MNVTEGLYVVRQRTKAGAVSCQFGKLRRCNSIDWTLLNTGAQYGAQYLTSGHSASIFNMVGSLVIGGITTVLGYLYPAYECYKCVEKKRPDGQYLRFWCQYWMIIALVTVLERLGGAFIPFIPMYLEAKLAFFIYLWYPKTRGTTYIYNTFVRPFFAGHEEEIDQTLSEIQSRGGRVALVYWQRISVYLQSHFLELLQHLASQTPKPPNAPPGVSPPGFQVQNNLRDRRQGSSTYNG